MKMTMVMNRRFCRNGIKKKIPSPILSWKIKQTKFWWNMCFFSRFLLLRLWDPSWVDCSLEVSLIIFIVIIKIMYILLILLIILLIRYIKEMYQLDAFTQSNPADQDIINIYKQQQGVRYACHKNDKDIHLHHLQVKEARGAGVSLLHNLHPILTGRLRFFVIPHHPLHIYGWIHGNQLHIIIAIVPHYILVLDDN